MDVQAIIGLINQAMEQHARNKENPPTPNIDFNQPPIEAGAIPAKEISNAFGKWLVRSGVKDDIAEKIAKLSTAIGKQDDPSLKVFGPKGEEFGPWFQSNDNQAHIIRVNLLMKSILDKFQKELNINDAQKINAIASTATHDAGKLTVPTDILSRTNGVYEKPELNFPSKAIYLPSFNELLHLPKGNEQLQELMLNYYRRNGLVPQFKKGNFTAKDTNVMQSHAPRSMNVGKKFGLPDDLVRDGAMHHIDVDMSGGYPSKFFNKYYDELPVSTRAGSMADIFDAITDKRYGLDQKPFEKSMDFFSVNAANRELPSAGTQIDKRMYDLFVNSELPKKLYNEVSGARGEDLLRLLNSSR